MSSSFIITNDGQSSSGLEVLNGFIPLICITEGVGLLAVTLILVWIFKYNGGLGIVNPQSEFSWHPFYMSLGFIYLMGNAILIFRILREWPKRKIKIIHASIHGVVLVLVAIALFAVIDYHNKKGFSNFYSVHSWIGLSTLTFFMVQLCFGFLAFLYPGLDDSIKSSLLPYHVYFGNAILVMAIAAAVSGINEEAIFSITNYHDLPFSAILLNLASILFVLFGILVIYITTKIHYKRRPRPGDITSSEITSLRAEDTTRTSAFNS